MRRFILLLLPLLLFAQDPTQTLSFNLTSATTSSTVFAGQSSTGVGQPSNTWVVTWYVDGASFTAATVYIDGAPDNNGVAGSFVHISSSDCDGTTNGTNAARGRIIVKSFYPYIRVNVTAVTGAGGYVRGQLLGYKGTSPIPCAVNATVVPSGTQDVNVVGENGTPPPSAGVAGVFPVGGVAAAAANLSTAARPVPVGGSDYGGTPKLQIPFTDSAGASQGFLGCTSTAEVALSGTSYTEIVAGVSSQIIRVCKILVTSSSGGNPTVNTFTVARATVTTCGTATELLVAAGVTGLDSDFGGGLRSGASQSICVKEATGQSDKVTIVYAQY